MGEGAPSKLQNPSGYPILSYFNVVQRIGPSMKVLKNFACDVDYGANK
jgi:hypothetical protein